VDVVDVNALKILSKMAKNEDGTNERFQFKDPKSGKVLCSCASLEELYECVLKLDAEIIHRHLCTTTDSEVTNVKDLPFYIHYVFGDAELSMKLYTLAKKYENDPEALKLELNNILFTRLLNYSEISLIAD